MNNSFGLYFDMMQDPAYSNTPYCKAMGDLMEGLTDHNVERCRIELEYCDSPEEALKLLEKEHYHVAYTLLMRHAVDLRHLYDSDEDHIAAMEELKLHYKLPQHDNLK